jgi:hypothetical protein
LEYKQKFRRIIAKELDKNTEIRNYFDNWGNRCYLFTAETGLDFNIYKTNKMKTIKNLELNSAALRDMGVQYIFSGVKILNYKDNKLIYLRHFTSEDSPYNIYLYKLETRTK